MVLSVSDSHIYMFSGVLYVTRGAMILWPPPPPCYVGLLSIPVRRHSHPWWLVGHSQPHILQGYPPLGRWLSYCHHFCQRDQYRIVCSPVKLFRHYQLYVKFKWTLWCCVNYSYFLVLQGPNSAAFICFIEYLKCDNHGFCRFSLLGQDSGTFAGEATFGEINSKTFLGDIPCPPPPKDRTPGSIRYM